MGGCFNTPSNPQPAHRMITLAQYRQFWKRNLDMKSITLSQAVLSNGNSVIHPCFQQISKDITRTYPKEAEIIGQQNQKRFERLLKRFALYLPALGYTQGINFVGGYFLVSKMDEESALKCLIQLTIHPQMMWLGLYQDNFPLCMLYCDLFWVMLLHMSPKTYHQLKSLNIPDQLWIFQWFLTCFIYSFPIEYIAEFMTFITGGKGFSSVCLAIGIIKVLEGGWKGWNQDQFMKCFEQLKSLSYCRDRLPVNQVLKAASNLKPEFIESCLKKTTVQNWYKTYFLTEDHFQKIKHASFISTLNSQRSLLLQNTVKSCVTSPYQYKRMHESVMIMDSIEETKEMRYSASFARMTETERNLMTSNLFLKNWTTEMEKIKINISLSELQ